MPESNPLIRFRANLAATLSGQAWAVLMQLLLVPVYIQYLGVEAYGVIAFFLMAQGLSKLFDFGLSPTLTRELARHIKGVMGSDNIRDLARTVETGYWLIGVVVAILFFLGAGSIATLWLQSDSLEPESLRSILQVAALALFFQWPMSMYQSGFMGLHQLVTFNVIRIIFSTLNVAGILVVLILISPGLLAVLYWQAILFAAHTFTLAFFFWRVMPTGDHPRIRWGLLSEVRAFAVGMTGLTITGIILGQIDKVVLSKILSLDGYGYYMLAAAVSGGINLIIVSLYNVFFPRFSTLVSMGDESVLGETYRKTSQAVAVMVFPLSAILALFSAEVLHIWTGNTIVVEQASVVLSLLVLGTAINSAMHLPYALQLAQGWTSLPLFINMGFIVTMVPAVIVMAENHGPIGAALVWAALNCVYFVVGAPLTHSRILRGMAMRWMTVDIGLIALAAAAPVLAARLLAPATHSPLAAVVSLAVAYMLSVVLSLLAATELRPFVQRTLSQFREVFHR